MESEANLVAASEPQSDTPPAQRLVIRVVLPKGALEARTQRSGLSRRALLAISIAAAAVLIWLGVSIFRDDSTSQPPVTAAAPSSHESPINPPPARTEAAPPVRAETLATEPTTPVAPEASPPQADAPSTPISEVLPDIPQSALDTIRGTVRVVIRVILDKEGAVVAAASDVPGPSRYFERHSLEASKKWKFTPTKLEEPRVMLVRFHYRRDGVTAQWTAVQ